MSLWVEAQIITENRILYNEISLTSIKIPYIIRAYKSVFFLYFNSDLMSLMFEAEGRMVIAFRPVDKYPKFQIKFDGV